jgi:hypothetical protein
MFLLTCGKNEEIIISFVFNTSVSREKDYVNKQTYKPIDIILTIQSMGILS